MRTLVIAAAVSLAAVAHAARAAQPAAAHAPDEVPSVEKLEKTVADAPGPVNCYQNTTGDRLTACEEREKGLAAFKKLYELDKSKAIAALQKRFDEIPSPKGGYFPILAAAQVKDKAFLSGLRKVAASQKGNDLGTFAVEAAHVIENGKCSQSPAPKKLAEICQ